MTDDSSFEPRVAPGRPPPPTDLPFEIPPEVIEAVSASSNDRHGQFSSNGIWWWDGTDWRVAVSPSGQWRWNGDKWVPAVASRAFSGASVRFNWTIFLSALSMVVSFGACGTYGSALMTSGPAPDVAFWGGIFALALSVGAIVIAAISKFRVGSYIFPLIGVAMGAFDVWVSTVPACSGQCQ